MKIAVVGSRSISDYDYIKLKLDEIKNISEIISGGAFGIDSLAERYAINNNIPITIFFPDWKKY